MKKYLPLILLSAVFFLIKIGGIGIRISDSNIYFYTAYQLLEGQILYKDIFFTNFPLLPYISTIYFLLLGGDLALYTFTPTIEVIVVGSLIYKIILDKKQNIYIAALTTAVYYFSFITLATSDHQTGVFLASIFSVAAYYFYVQKRMILSGILIALCLMTKAYFLPVFLALAVVLLLKERKKSIFFFGAFFITVVLVLLPSLIFSPSEIYNNIIEYSLTRSQGVSKLNILRFFTTHDIILVILFFYSLVRFKKNEALGLINVFGLIFVLLYKDVYYLYLNFVVAYLCLALPDLLEDISKKVQMQKYIIPFLISILLGINTVIYLSSYQSLQKIEGIETITASLKSHQSKYIYGTNDIAPALAYLSGKKLVAGVVDTNENIFLKGFLNGEEMTKEAINQNALIVSHGAYYPYLSIDETVIGSMFDKNQMTKNCLLIGAIPVTTEGMENRITFFECLNEK